MTADAAQLDLRTVRLGVLSAVIEGDAGRAHRMILDLLGGGVSFESIIVEILTPLQREVGGRWETGDFFIADEHASTGTVETLVALLAGSFDRPDDARHILAVCAEGDLHSLPTRMASAYLTYRGWHVTYLGASLPAGDLEHYVHEVEADAVVLGCSMTPWLLGARGCIRAAHSAGLPVAVGGQAFGLDDGIARKLGADAWSPALHTLDEVLRGWDPDPGSAEAAAADPGDEVGRIVDLHPDLVAAGLRVVRESLAELGWPLEAVPDRTNEFGLLVSSLASAMLIDRPSVFGEFAASQAEWLREHGAPDEIGGLFVDGLESALAGRVPQATTFLVAAREATGAA